MEKLNIGLYAIQALEKYQYLSTEIVQKYIRDDPSSGVIVSAEEIEDVLNMLVQDKWLDYISGCGNGISFYERYDPKKYNNKYLQ